MPDSGDPMDCSLPGSSVNGILQARILEWIAIFFSRGSPSPWGQIQVSCTAGIFSTNWGMREAQSESESHPVMSNSLWPDGLSPWDSPGQNTGAGSLSLLQGIFPTQGSNPGLPHCRWILYQLSHNGMSEGQGSLACCSSQVCSVRHNLGTELQRGTLCCNDDIGYLETNSETEMQETK